MKKIIIAIVFLAFLSSCVPAKDLIYLQEKEQTEAKAIQAITFKPYRVQLGDQLKVEIKTDFIDEDAEKFMKIFGISSETATTANSFQEGALYFSSYTVDDHGNIRIPVIEEVNVLGFTTDEIRKKIERELKDNLFTDEVKLFVDVKLAGFRFTVNGEVTKTGSHVLFKDRVNIMEAIAQAGDITLTGNRKEVTIIRQYPHGSEIHTIDLTDRKSMESPYFFIQPNDYIYVKPLPQKSWGTGVTGSQTLSTIVAGLSLIMTTIVLLRTL